MSMHRTRRRFLAAIATGGLLAAGSAFLPAPSSAAVCAEGRVFVGGSGPSAGRCVSLMDQWYPNCAGGDVFPLGYGAGATVCVPTPI